MEVVNFLAKTTGTPGILDGIGVFLFKFILSSFALYLCTHLIKNIPMLSRFFEISAGRLVIYVLTMAAAVLLLYFLPRLRLLHEIKLITKAGSLIWADIAFSALTLASLSMLWPGLFRWLDEILKRNA